MDIYLFQTSFISVVRAYIYMNMDGMLERERKEKNDLNIRNKDDEK